MFRGDICDTDGFCILRAFDMYNKREISRIFAAVFEAVRVFVSLNIGGIFAIRFVCNVGGVSELRIAEDW